MQVFETLKIILLSEGSEGGSLGEGTLTTARTLAKLSMIPFYEDFLRSKLKAVHSLACQYQFITGTSQGLRRNYFPTDGIRTTKLLYDVSEINVLPDHLKPLHNDAAIAVPCELRK